jgi:hypothetical protein
MMTPPSTGRTTETLNVHVLVLPQASVAVQRMVLVEFAGNDEPDGGAEVIVTLLHTSVAVTVQKTGTALVPQVFTTILLGQMIVGGVVSTTVTICLQLAALLQQSTAVQVRTTISGQAGLLVTVLATEIDTFVPQQASEAVGGSNVQAVPHWTVLLVAQVITGGVVSTTVTFWVQ